MRKLCISREEIGQYKTGLLFQSNLWRSSPLSLGGGFVFMREALMNGSVWNEFLEDSKISHCTFAICLRFNPHISSISGGPSVSHTWCYWSYKHNLAKWSFLHLRWLSSLPAAHPQSDPMTHISQHNSSVKYRIKCASLIQFYVAQQVSFRLLLSNAFKFTWLTLSSRNELLLV